MTLDLRLAAAGADFAAGLGAVLALGMIEGPGLTGLLPLPSCWSCLPFFCASRSFLSFFLSFFFFLCFFADFSDPGSATSAASSLSRPVESPVFCRFGCFTVSTSLVPDAESASPSDFRPLPSGILNGSRGALLSAGAGAAAPPAAAPVSGPGAALMGCFWQKTSKRRRRPASFKIAAFTVAGCSCSAGRASHKPVQVISTRSLKASAETPASSTQETTSCLHSSSPNTCAASLTPNSWVASKGAIGVDSAVRNATSWANSRK
mmetsp:Transcript_38431/g.100598  ORF Transcript_38431/g.100598 Transcript_38431/m.100598 type:complete len:263 (+) Transcript_38431:843-1631(+)